MAVDECYDRRTSSAMPLSAALRSCSSIVGTTLTLVTCESRSATTFASHLIAVVTR